MYVVLVDEICNGVFFVFRSSRPNYGDKAIGKVQIRRNGRICTVKGKITPEHKVRAKPYSISCTIDEENEEITYAECDDCPASQGNYSLYFES